jgi:hypothetical protein
VVVLEEDQTVLDLDQLAVLWPRLEAALARDTAGPSAEHGRSGNGGGEGSAAVLNLDVVQAVVEISTGAQAIAAEVVRILNLDSKQTRTTGALIEAMPDWYVQLRNRDQPVAKHIKDDATRWLRQARIVLRLRTHEAGLGRLCPEHRDTHPTELRREADEATLSPAVLAGRQQPIGSTGLPLEAGLTWKRSESVYCPKCKKRWDGVVELRVLMRMIAVADKASAPVSPNQETPTTTEET